MSFATGSAIVAEPTDELWDKLAWGFGALVLLLTGLARFCVRCWRRESDGRLADVRQLLQQRVATLEQQLLVAMSRIDDSMRRHEECATDRAHLRSENESLRRRLDELEPPL